MFKDCSVRDVEFVVRLVMCTVLEDILLPFLNDDIQVGNRWSSLIYSIHLLIFQNLSIL